MAMFKSNPNYSKPEITKRVYELRTKGESWHNISALILKEFNLKITDPTIKTIYERFVAKNLLIQGSKEEKLAQEIVPDYQKKMDERFNKISKATDELMDMLSELKKNIPPMLYVKFIPTILMVCREILNQLTFIKKEQTQVLVNQKNLIYSPLQIMNIVNQEMIKLEKEGKIEIKDVATGIRESDFKLSAGENGRVLTDEEKEEIRKNLFSQVKSDEEKELEKKKEEEIPA